MGTTRSRASAHVVVRARLARRAGDRRARGGSVWVALTAGGPGDYPHDAGPAITALLHGNLHAFAAARPAMGELSLLLRAPFAALGSDADGALDLSLGRVPCVAAVALLGALAGRRSRARAARRRSASSRSSRVAMLNPLVHSAIAHRPSRGAADREPRGRRGRDRASGARRERRAARSRDGDQAVGGAGGVPGDRRRRRAPAARAPRSRVAVAAAVYAAGVRAVAVGVRVATSRSSSTSRSLSPSALSWLYLLAPHVTLHLAGGCHRPRPAPVGRARRAAASADHRPRPRDRRRGRCGARARRPPPAAAPPAVALIFVLRCTARHRDDALLPAAAAGDAAGLGRARRRRLPLRSLRRDRAAYALFDRLTPPLIGARRRERALRRRHGRRSARVRAPASSGAPGLRALTAVRRLPPPPRRPHAA